MKLIRFYNVSHVKPVFEDYLQNFEMPIRFIFCITTHSYSPYKYRGTCFVIQDNHISSFEIPYEECWWLMEGNGEDYIQAGMAIVSMFQNSITRFIYRSHPFDQAMRLELQMWFKHPKSSIFIGL